MKYPIGIQNFTKVRQERYVYVDKTAFIYKLASEGSYYFLSRPRRFGKSLLISTMDAYFRGQKELFRGLALEALEKDWTVYPVVHIDLNTGKYDSEDALFHVLNDYLCKLEDVYGKYPSEVTPELRFKGIIERIAKKHNQRVVILVDEYDKPMLQAIYRQSGTAGALPQHAESILLRVEDPGPVYQVRVPNGGDEVWKGQRLQ